MKKYTLQKIAGTLLPMALILGGALPVGAEVNPSIKTNLGVKAETKAAARVEQKKVRLEAKEQAMVTRSIASIDKRVTDLTALSARVDSMVHVSSATKASLSSSLSGAIASLGELKTKISADTDPDQIKLDEQSVVQGTRIYMLVIPQSRILAAGDRANTIADMMTAFNTKLTARITAADEAGKDVKASMSAQADMVAKIADAKIQAAAAIAAVANLTPDNGDKVKMQENETALKSGRTALAAAEKDLKAAEKDMKTAVASLKGMKLNEQAQ